MSVKIFVPSSLSIAVMVDGRPAQNCRELEAEARAAVEPQIRERWAQYWERIVQHAEICMHAEALALDEVMYVPASPSRYYDCPAELAMRAKGVTHEATR